MQFKDYFSDHAQIYAAFRPAPPQELIQHLVALAPARELAWDCATGNGQGAQLLVEHFAQVIATDASAEQIAAAVPHERIQYRVALAEDSGIPDHCIDLVTVGCAIHWFDQERFYQEVTRVLKPDGVIAVWGYTRLEALQGPEPLDESVRRIFQDFESFLSPEVTSIWHGYDRLFFPFRHVEMTSFSIEEMFTLDRLIGFLRSTSAVITWVKQKGEQPVEQRLQEIRQAWGNVTYRPIRWPLLLKVGRVP